MRRRSHIGALVSQTVSRLERLKSLAGALSPYRSAEQDRLAAFVAIEMSNGWALFLREYYLSATVVGARDGSGSRLYPLATMSERDALLRAIFHADNRRYVTLTNRGRNPSWWDEPKWFNPQIFNVVVTGMTFTNQTKIGAAFSVTSDVFLSLPVLRNFFAHRGKNTIAKISPVLSRHGLPSDMRPAQVMAFVPSGQAANLTEIWLSDLLTIARGLT